MATCEICGTDFDDFGVQLVVPGLSKGFCRVDCAIRARTLAGATGGAVPMRAVLVPLAARSATGLFALGGLSAGLAAALAGTRARVALGGATVGVALLVATTAHLATRGGDVTEPTVRPQTLAPPARYAGDSADRARASVVAGTAAQQRSGPQVRYTLLAASRSADVPRAARVMTVSTRTRTHAPKAVLHARHGTGGKTPTASSGSGGKGSSRPGWGRGDKNHSHGGPSTHKSSGSSKHSKPAKHGKSHKHK
jgi:hypothetical protein